MRSSFPPK